ncbi:MAG: hypothetical protein ACOCRK_10695 [bacterium]
MKNIKDIYRAVEYIKNSLKSNLSVEKIANHIGYSLYSLFRLIPKQAIKKDYLNYINNSIVIIKTEIINENDIYLIGQIVNSKLTDKTLNKIINNLDKIKEDAEKYIVYFYPINSHHKRNELISYKAHSLESTPSIMVEKKIPAQKYSKFIITANYFNMKYLFQYLYQTRFKSTQIKINASYSIERILGNISGEKLSKVIYIPLD